MTGREADDSHPSSAKVKNAWSYTSTLPYVLMPWCLSKGFVFVTCYVLKYRGNFTFAVFHKSGMPFMSFGICIKYIRCE
jgi:hypothetical protein